MKSLAVILAGGEGSRLGILTAKRTKPAVPFAGKFRIIDFALSNCVNSGLFDVMILAQYRPHSLIEHIGHGRPVGSQSRRSSGGVRIYSPYQSRATGSGWFVGTADAVQQNFLFIKDRQPDVVVHAQRRPHLPDELRRAGEGPRRLRTPRRRSRPSKSAEEDAKRFGIVSVDG